MTNTKWSLILGIPVAIAATTTIITFVNNPIFRCSIAHFVGIESSFCANNISTVQVHILTETGDALKGVEVEFIGNDTPETQYTDKDGFTKAQIASIGDIKIRVKAKDYPVQDVFVNLNTSQTITREIRLSKTGQPIVSTPTPNPTSTTPTATAEPPKTPPISQSSPPPSTLPITVVVGSVTWELKSCIAKQNNIVSCNFLLTSGQDVAYNVSLNGDTKIVDGSNNEYYAKTIYVGNKTAGTGNIIYFNMVKDAHSNVTIEFKEIPISVSQTFLLQIRATGSVEFGTAQFRNFPITHS